MLTKVVVINEVSGHRRLLGNWFYLYRNHLLYSLGTSDLSVAQERAKPWDRLLPAIFESTEESFTDEDPLPQKTTIGDEPKC